jgi:hypothetical protein
VGVNHLVAGVAGGEAIECTLACGELIKKDAFLNQLKPLSKAPPPYEDLVCSRRRVALFKESASKSTVIGVALCVSLISAPG